VRELAQGHGGDAERLFRPSLAFNLLLDIDLSVDCALAVAAPQPGAPIMFLVPQSGALLAGTMHLPRPAGTTQAKPTEAEIAACLAHLNQAIPGLGARTGNVRRVLAGLLPATRFGSAKLARREVICDHGAEGGLAGLYTVSGTKFTTANEVAKRVIATMGGTADQQPPTGRLPLSIDTPVMTNASSLSRLDSASLRDAVRRVIAGESVQCLDDLVLRRANWGLLQADRDTWPSRIRQLMDDPVLVPFRSAIASNPRSMA
jgi:glycerol-3-phosphate dehydrogenase